MLNKCSLYMDLLPIKGQSMERLDLPVSPHPSCLLHTDAQDHSDTRWSRKVRGAAKEQVESQATVEKEAGILAQPLTSRHLPNPSLSGTATILNVDKRFFLFSGLVWFGLVNQSKYNHVSKWSRNASEQGLWWTHRTPCLRVTKALPV